jgi:hypothetical protein
LRRSAIGAEADETRSFAALLTMSQQIAALTDPPHVLTSSSGAPAGRVSKDGSQAASALGLSIS